METYLPDQLNNHSTRFDNKIEKFDFDHSVISFINRLIDLFLLNGFRESLEWTNLPTEAVINLKENRMQKRSFISNFAKTRKRNEHIF